MKRILILLSICAVCAIALTTTASAAVQCIGPGPCVIPVTPPSTCVDGGTPGTPFSVVVRPTSPGVTAVVKITPAPNCQLVVTSVYASLSGEPGAAEITNFTIWQTSDTTCGTPDGIIWFQEDMAVGPYTPVDHLTLGAPGPIIVTNPNQNVCVGFSYGLTGVYEKFNASFVSR